MRLLVAAIVLALFLVPVLGGRYETYLVTQIVIFALFALALNLLVGFGGLVSFGHAAYFAIGAYAVAILGTTLQWPFALTLVCAILLSAAAALVIGYFCVRLTSIYLAMLTLAFAQLVWAIAFQWRGVTRGDTGFIGLRVPDLISTPQAFYYFALSAALLSGLVLWLITRSAFGRTLVSTRENEMRAESVGVNVRRVRLIAFVVSGMFSGLAGGLFALFNRSVFPDFAWWTMSAEVLIMTILGGIYSFFGPALGAAAIILLDTIITEHTEYWPTVLGVVLLVVLFVFPDGLAGLAGRLRKGGRAVETPQQARCARRTRSRQERYQNARARANAGRARGCPAMMLRTEDLTKSFDGFIAVNGVDLEIGQGERHAIIGPNGAGKTTLFNLLTGHLAPDRGDVYYGGETITGLVPHRIVAKGIARSFQHINIYPRLTVFQNLQAALIPRHGAQYRLFTAAEGLYSDEAREILAAVGLEADAGRLAGTLAYGRQKQLELAIALAARPDLLLLDEPTAGMSPQETRQTIESIGTVVRDRGLSLLFTEHDMDVVFTIADRISVLHLGRVIASGTPDEVRSSPEVRRVYLGEGERGSA